ncbi:MAG: ABC transporter ATP-binding protein [Alphaproteobacteria bacterium]
MAEAPDNTETSALGDISHRRDHGTPQLELRGITKQYPGVLANDNISLAVAPGGVHALLGENGAGKSTLVKIIYGVVKPDAGEILWNGEPTVIQNPAHARRLGIGMVFQHFNLFDTLTVAENISLGMEGAGDLKSLAGRVSEISERYGLPINPHQHVHALSVGERQRVEIVRCLLQNPKLLIMDEPTSVLTPQEVEKLFVTLKRLGSEGCSILYISHKLEEIRELCDDATVLRGGKVVAVCDPRNETPKSLAEMMIGSEIPVIDRAAQASGGRARLEVTKLSLPSDDPFGTTLKEIDLTVRGGEVLGIAGVAGNGQKEFLMALSGEKPVADNDAVKIDGKSCGRIGPAARRALGLAFVPEERLGRGAVPEMSLAKNALLTGYRTGMVRNGLIQFGRIADYASNVRQAYDVKSAGVEAEARSLSGGNLQKFIIGREIGLDPGLLLLAYPTWGVDVGAATTIHRAIMELKKSGTAVLVVSEDLDELFDICDRLAVIAEGRLSSVVNNGEVTIEEIGLWMSGDFDARTGSSGKDAAPHAEAADAH